MADDEQKILLEARRLPLPDRVGHKNWRVRSEAWEDVRARCERAFSSSDPILDEAGPLFAKGVADTNANTMDKSLEALDAWLKKAEIAHASAIASSVCYAMASKCLKSRPGTLGKAIEDYMLFIELEQQDIVMESLLKILTDKVPKTVSAALDAICQALISFGSIIDVKPIIKTVPQIFGHSNAAVRDKAKELAVGLASVAGTSVVQSTWLEKMNDAMRKDVEAGIAEIPPGKHRPARLTRREAAKQASASPDDEFDDTVFANGGDVATEDTACAMDVAGGLDAYEVAEPVDILPQLNKMTITVGDDSVSFWDCFESKKWNVRKGALDKVREMAKTPRLASVDYNDLCRELRKVLSKDANVNCAASAADVVSALALGLRQDFHSQARQFASPLLERFKEKNTSMSRAANDALRTLGTYCFKLFDISDDIAAALTHKNPKVRLDSLRLVKDLTDISDKPTVSKSKEVLPAVAKLAPDADANVREAAQSALVSIALKLGSFSSIQPALAKLDESRRKTIEDAVVAAAKQNLSSGSSSRGPPESHSMKETKNKYGVSLVASSVGSSSSVGGTTTAPLKSDASMLTSRKPMSRAASSSSVKNKGKSMTKNASVNSRDPSDESKAPVSGRLTPEEASEKLASLVGRSSIVEELGSPQWQTRLEAMNLVLEKVSAASTDPTTLDVILCVEHLPGWAEKNFQVMNKSFEIISLLAAESPSFDRLQGSVAIEGASDRLHELKHRTQATKALDDMAEVLGPRFVAAQLHRRAAANKNPKALSEALTWLGKAVEDFGLAAMDLASIVEWMIGDLGSSNAAVRANAMAVLGKCHAQVGPDALMPRLSESLKPAQVGALEEVFKKHPVNPQFEATKSVRARSRNVASSAAPASSIAAADEILEAVGVEGISVDDALPRHDISGSLTPSLIDRISSANWKERNAALDDIEAALKEAGFRIIPNVPLDLLSALRGRFGDTNRNLAAKTLMLLSKFADSIGPPFDKLARQTILMPALATLNDNKKQVRDAAVALLNAWGRTCPPEKLMGAVAESATMPKSSSDGRVAALTWISTAIKEASGAGTDPSAIDDGTFRSIAITSTDKSSLVRDASLGVLRAIAGRYGGEPIASRIAKLPSPQKNALEPLLRKATAGLPASSSFVSRGQVHSTGGFDAGSTQAPTDVVDSFDPQHPSNGLSAAPAASEGRGSRASSIASERPPPILLMNGGKASRARSVRVRVTKFDGLPADELELLEVGFAGNVASPEFKELLFSHDFRDHMKAVDALVASTSSSRQELIASLDLIFRWMTYRLCEGNPQASVRILESIPMVMEALREEDYRLSDAEAHALLPAIVDRCGHNQDRMRALYRDVLRASCLVYSVSKVLEFVSFGLSSKSNRTRMECCDVVRETLQRDGIDPVAACKAQPMVGVAGLLKDRDGGLRAAALATIVECAARGGVDTMWRLVAKVDTKEKSLIEDRLRRSNAVTAGEGSMPFKKKSEADPASGIIKDGDSYERASIRNGNPASSFEEASEAASSLGVMQERYVNGRSSGLTPPNALDVTPEASFNEHYESDRHAYSQGVEKMSAAVTTTPPMPHEVASHHRFDGDSYGVKTPIPGSGYASHTPIPASLVPTEVAGEEEDRRAFEQQWSSLLSVMAGNNLLRSIDATKQLCAEIMAVSNSSDQRYARGALAVMAASTERLFKIVTSLLRSVFEHAEKEAAMGQSPSSRGCKYALNVMLQSMGVPEIAGSLPQAELRESVALLLGRLVDDRGLMVFEDGPTLVRAVNVLVAKMLESSNKNYCFAGLLQLLREPPSDIPKASIIKFHDLVVKCLIKLTKAVVSSDIDTAAVVDLSSLLFCLHDFFLFLGVDGIRKRSSTDDRPLRMVKTILYELCKKQEYAIYNYTECIPGRDASPPPIIFAYIQLNLRSLEQSGQIKPSEQGIRDDVLRRQQTPQSHPPHGSSSFPSPETHRSPSPDPYREDNIDAAKAAAKAEVKQSLKTIMNRLVQKEPAAQDAALRELLLLRKKHPEYVERYIAGTSELFRRFIEEGMARLSTQAEEEGEETMTTPASDSAPTSASRLPHLRERFQSLRLSAELSPGFTRQQSSPAIRTAKEYSNGTNVQTVPADDGKSLSPSNTHQQSIEELSARLSRLKRNN